MELLKGKNVVITGARRGIGRATVETFAKEGANIWACARKPDKEFEEEMKRLAARENVWIKPVYFDLEDPSQIKEGAQIIIEKKENIDVLINIAGITFNALFHMTTREDFLKIFQIDFLGQMLLSQPITRRMMKQRFGKVINISSFIGMEGNRGQIAYSAAKGAMIAATKTMAKEMKDYGITINVVCPSVIDTDMTKSLTDEQKEDLLTSGNFSEIISPKNIADILVFLSSDYISTTGQIYSI